MAILMLLSTVAMFSSCGETNPDEPVIKETLASNVESEGDTVEEDQRFDGIDYEGREFRVYTSVAPYVYMETSNLFIEGSDELNGALVNDTVLERNLYVEELLDIEMVYTHCDLTWGSIAADIRKLTTSGTNEYDLVINDIYDFAPLVIEGNFHNVLDDECVFDFEQNYWYQDFMEDLRLMNGYQYILAGDYFLDIMRTAHLLLVNKDIYMEYFKSSADELYDVVLNYEWTYDKMFELTSTVYTDTNGNSKRDKGDRYGYITGEYWGGSIPFSVSGNPPFITRDEDGVPTITIHEGDRANRLATAMSRLFNDDTSSINMTTFAELPQAFANGEALIIGNYRLGMLENTSLREMESDVAVLPYPMLDSSDRKYTTSSHDTTEMGAILITAKDLSYISTVVEVLNRETARILIPKYYKENLQVKCVDDEKAASMIDIVHDNFGNSFILAYNVPLGSCILNSFSDAMEQEREFSSVYQKYQRSVNRTLQKKIELFQEKNGLV